MMRNRTVLIVVLAVIAAASLPLFAGPYFLSVFNTIFVYMSLALTWDMMLRTGQLSYGTAGLFGLGAYASALLVAKAGVNPLVSIAAGGVFAGLLAFFLGFAVLRLRKIYFSITTLALTTVFSVVIRNLPRLTGGASGTVLPRALFNGDPAKNYWMVLGLALAVIAISVWLSKSKTHYAINAIRNDEITARSSGIDVFRYLLFIFVLTSAIQGVIGAFYAQQYAFVQPEARLYELPFAALGHDAGRRSIFHHWISSGGRHFGPGIRVLEVDNALRPFNRLRHYHRPCGAVYAAGGYQGCS